MNTFEDVLSFQKKYGLERNLDLVDPVPTEIAQGSSRSSLRLSDNVCDINLEPSTTMSGMYLKKRCYKANRQSQLVKKHSRKLYDQWRYKNTVFSAFKKITHICM